MLKRLIEAQAGRLTSMELRAVLDLATTDIRVNRVSFGRRTSLADAVGIAEICCTVLRR
ncbi:hypothetical protein [Desulfitobacterium hafniense]|uniref:hypothetical protein n=1 Tax=Desulfitobacterium hafniense TaxID=49338 RepID=UPI00156445FA|nr:hypothetical protein [Desulfitobacterium hafniense]